MARPAREPRAPNDASTARQGAVCHHVLGCVSCPFLLVSKRASPRVHSRKVQQAAPPTQPSLCPLFLALSDFEHKSGRVMGRRTRARYVRVRVRVRCVVLICRLVILCFSVILIPSFSPPHIPSPPPPLHSSSPVMSDHLVRPTPYSQYCFFKSLSLSLYEYDWYNFVECWQAMVAENAPIPVLHENVVPFFCNSKRLLPVFHRYLTLATLVKLRLCCITFSTKTTREPSY